MCSPLIVKSVFLILGMNEMSQFLDSVLRLETDTGDSCWRLCLWWRWEIDTELCLCSTLTGVLKNKHPYYKSSVFSVCSPLNSSCCDISKHSEMKHLLHVVYTLRMKSLEFNESHAVKYYEYIASNIHLGRKHYYTGIINFVRLKWKKILDCY